MVTQCDFTNSDGTVNQAQADAADGDTRISPIEQAQIISAFDDGSPVSGCSGGKTGICDFTASDGSVTSEQAEAAQVARLGDRLSIIDAAKIQTAFDQGGVVNECAPTPDTSTAKVTDINAASNTPNELSVSVTVTNQVTSGSGETLTPTVEITANGALIESDTFTLPPGESAGISSVNQSQTGEVEVCANVV